MKTFIFFVLVLCISACNLGQKKSNYESFEERWAKELAIEDSINNAVHKRIDDSLIVNDKGLVLDSIFLGMPKKNFKKKFDELKSKTNNKISINGVDFWLNDLEMDFGRDNILHIFCLSKTYEIGGYIDTKNPSNTRVYDESKDFKKKLYEHFSKKYGEPQILKDNKKCHIDDANLLSWVFSTRRIDVILSSRNMIYLKISDTSYYNRQKEIQDSLDNLYHQRIKESHEVSEKYGSQL